MHVRDDVGQGRAREELEAALGIADGGGGGRGEESDKEVEGAHEEVAEVGSLVAGKNLSNVSGASSWSGEGFHQRRKAAGGEIVHVP